MQNKMRFTIDKIIFTLAGIFLFTAATAQQHGKVKYLKKDNYGSVYVTKDTSIREYNWLSVVSFNKEVTSAYTTNYNVVLKDTLVLTKHFSINEKLLLNWTPLYIYNDNYYVYSPSDWMAHFNYLVNDSAIIEYKTDGPDAMILLDYQELSSSEFLFKILSYDKVVSELRIKIIDPAKQITLWIFKSKNYKNNMLIVNGDRVKEYPMVKCDCNGQKCLLEFEFDKINEEMISKKGW
ncbi:MAG: hypothetical protein ABI772_06875 [Bacteroidota bacterium]